MAPSQAWAGKPAWRVLDTAFGDGRRFLNTWQAWAEDPHTPRLLHYVAITPLAPDGDALLRALSSHPEIAAHSPDLVHQSFGFLRGFHRIALHQARVLLTVCVGELQAMLREQQFVADAVYLTALPDVSGPQSWDRWRIKALTRLCRRGTAVEITRATSQLRDDLAQAGFVFEEPAPEVASASSLAGGNALLHGQYQPRWEPGSTRDNWRAAAPTVSSCVVIGAGLAGALVARALARRGWQVTVLDAAEQPAAGASGLPVGLLAPQVSRDDSTRSRLSRAGLRATLAQCHALLQHGEDWAYPGVLELRPDACLGLPDGWPLSGRQWSDARPNDVASDTWTQGLVNGATSIWHTRAGWVKPSRLVQACLAHDRVRFVGNSKVHTITREDGQWILQNAQGAVLAGAPQLVIAAACDSLRLLDAAVANDRPTLARTGRLQDMAAVGGQISWAMHQTGDATAFPPFPVSGRGSFVAHVPWQGKRAWFTGATYEPGVTADFNHAAGRRENLERLSGLLPAVAKVLARRFADGQVQAWSGTRCTTIDRLPAVGPLEAGPQPGLWISAGMGSRGLTYAALCAEVLAAQLGGEPFSIESSLSRGLAAGRLQPTAPARPL